MVEFDRQNADVSYFELFKPKMINRTHIGVFTQIWSQLTGTNVMMYYISCESLSPLEFSCTINLEQMCSLWQGSLEMLACTLPRSDMSSTFS